MTLHKIITNGNDDKVLYATLAASVGAMKNINLNQDYDMNNGTIPQLSLKTGYKVVSVTNTTNGEVKTPIEVPAGNAWTNNTPNQYYASGFAYTAPMVFLVEIAPKSAPVVTTTEQTKTESVPFTTQNVTNPDKFTNEVTTLQEGVNGVRTIVETVTFTDGVETNRVVKSSTITTEPVPKIVETGTKTPIVYGYLMYEGSTDVTLTAVKTTGEVETGTPNVLWKLPTGDYTVTISANTGFYVNGFFRYDRYGREIAIPFEGNGKIVNQTITVGTRQDFKISTDLFQEEPEIPVPEPDFAGFNHLYKMDKTAMSSLANDRFTAPTGNPGESIDLGVNIINILELPFPLKAEFLRTEKNVILGVSTLNTIGIELMGDRYILDFAEIQIPHKYNNSYDFIDTEVKLHLPFVDSVTLPNEYCIGQTIKIRYSIDLYSGDTDVTISSTKLNNKIFHSQQVKLGRNIPFVRKSGETVTSITSNNGLNNDVYSPFVEVIRNKPYNAGGQFTTPIPVLTTLNEMQGFVRVEDIRLQTNATQEEQQAIKNLLRDGVFINGTN